MLRVDPLLAPAQPGRGAAAFEFLDRRRHGVLPWPAPAQDTGAHANAMLRSCIVHICGYCEAMEQRRRLFAGNRVRDLRRRLALPQAALATRLGVSVSYLSQIEN
ncbi:MAG: helix-turn-helix domain-containing protein, partial [Hyphomonas sp.]